jgi:site-specific recombinase XerD
VFLERRFAEGKDSPAVIFSNPVVLKEHLRHLAEEARASSAGLEKDVRKVVTALLRSLGQIPEKRVRQEFMKITKRIGCPWLTRAHSLRHFFATQAQEMGMNPLLVQGILGHTSLDMTARYTHLSLESKRQALRQMFNQAELLKVVKPA